MCNSLENPYPHHGGKLEIPGRGGGICCLFLVDKHSKKTTLFIWNFLKG